MLKQINMKPMPHIARLPGERLLEGVPHKANESVFLGEPGIVPALELINDTVDLNSKQRRPVLDQALGRLARKPDAAADLLNGLESLQSEAVLANAGKRRHAGFLAEVIRPRIGEPDSGGRGNDIELDVSPSDEDVITMDGPRSMRLIDLPVEKVRVPSDRIFKDPYLKHEVGKLVAMDAVHDPRPTELGVKLFNRFYDPEASLATTLIMYGNLAHAIDTAKVRATSRRHTTEVSNSIIFAAAATLAGKLPLDDETDEALTRTLAALRENPKTGWLYVKMLGMRNFYLQRREIAAFTKKFKGISDWVERSAPFGGEEVTETTRQAMYKLYTLRKYGIKPAYFRDGIMHHSEDSWIIEDAYETFGDIAEHHGWRAYNPQMAIITLAHGKKIEDVKGRLSIKDHGRGSVFVRETDWQAHFSMGMLPDGELIIAGSNGILPVRREFENMGMGQIYELFKLSHINRLIDLVVPADMVRSGVKMKQDPGLLGLIGNVRKFTKLSRLTLPRLRHIIDTADAIEQELAEEYREADERARRLLRGHEVVGHPRILPPGFQASPEARKRAAALGITLAENETWVKKHHRGDDSIGTVSSHLAVRR